MAEALPEVHAISRSQETGRGGVTFYIPATVKAEVSAPKAPPTIRKAVPLSARKIKLEDARAKTWTGSHTTAKPKGKRRASCDDQDAPLSDPDKVLKELLSPAQDTTDWTAQTGQILNLRRLVIHHADILIPELGHTLTVLEGFSNSLRSSVQRCAVQVYADIFRQPKLATVLVNHLQRILELLCTHAALANKFIREECEAILQGGIAEYSAKRMLVALSKIKHHNKAVQAQVALSLAAAAHSVSPPLDSTVINTLLQAIVSNSQEGLEQSRQAAKAMLTELQEKADAPLLSSAVAALTCKHQELLLNYATSQHIKLCVSDSLTPIPAQKRSRSNKENMSENEWNIEPRQPQPGGTLKTAMKLENNNHNIIKSPSVPISTFASPFILPHSPAATATTTTTSSAAAAVATSPSASAASSPATSPSASCANNLASTSTSPATPVAATTIHDGNTLTTTTFPNEDLILNTPVVLHKRSNPETVAYTYVHEQDSPIVAEDFGINLNKAEFSEITTSVVYSDRDDAPLLEAKHSILSSQNLNGEQKTMDWETCERKLQQVGKMLDQIAAARAARDQPYSEILTQMVALQREIANGLAKI